MWNQFRTSNGDLDGDLRNIYSVKITKLANMRKEMEVFAKTWEESIPQSVAMTAVKIRYIALHL